MCRTALLSYYRGIAILDINELLDSDIEQLAIKVTNNIREKVRKALLKYHYINKWNGEIVYPFKNEMSENDMSKWSYVKI